MHAANPSLRLSIAIGIGIRTLRCRILVLLVCAALGVFTYDAIATTTFSPPDLPHPNNLLRRIAAFFDTDPATDPPLPRRGKVSRSAPLSLGDLELFDGGPVAQSLSTTVPTAVGRVTGSHAVSDTGAATYTIPIWTPPGIRGLEPHLALTYASGTADSWLGPGWSLSGLSSISRCARTWAQDGAPGPVTLTTSDKFCLDGNRLRSTGGTYGAPLSTYQTEIETFSKVTSHSTAGNGPLWFQVMRKDGLTYEYGGTSDSRVLATGSSTPYLWALNKVSDRNGNTLVITYTQSYGSFRPLAIDYARGTTYHYRVLFGYITRPAGTVLSVFVAGSQVLQQMLISQISILSDGAIVRQYNLDYSTSPATRRSRLSAVQECTLTDCLRPTTITYQSGQAGIANASTSAGTGATSGRANTVDFNGDGRMDLVYSTVSGTLHRWWIKLATSAGFSAAISTGITTNAQDAVLFDDFDANGNVDLLAPSGGTWFVLRWSAGGFTWTSTGQSVDANSPYFVSADVNGDGLPDLVSGRTDKALHTRLNTTAGSTVSFSASSTVAAALFLSITGLWGNNSIPQSAVRHMDFNGDGRDDVLVRGSITRGSSIIQLLSQGTTFAGGDNALAGGVPLPLSWNDDACTDLFAGSYVRIAGCSTSPAVQLVPLAAGLLAADWDVDGRTDIFTVAGGVLQVHRSTGDGIATPVSTGITAASGIWTAFDQNGDGLADLSFAGASSGNAITYGLHNGANTMPDLATSITDGFGLNATFAYGSLSAWSSCYARDSGTPTFPSTAFIGPIYVVCNLTASNGVGGTYQVSHSYYNSNLNLQGRGWLGFERRYAIDNRDGIVSMESYNQSFPHIGLAQYELARQSDWTTKIREIVHTPSSLSLGSGHESRTFPFVSQSVDDSFEVGGALNGQWMARATTTTAVDSYGNPITVTASVTDKSTSSPWYGETFTTRTTNVIANDPLNWCLGRPTQTSVTSTLPDGTSQTRTSTATVDYIYCRNTQEIIEPSSSTLRVATTYGFDSCGNVNLVVVSGKNPDGTEMPARTIATNYGSRCQFPEATTNALNQTSRRAFRYDLGLVTSETDPNGLTTTSSYDGYGRKTEERRPDGTKTSWNFWFCDAGNSYCGVADLRWGFTQTELDNANFVITQKFVFHDALNRMRYDERLNLAGGLTYFTVAYDSLGRKSIEWVPVSTGGWHYHAFSYDLLNRPTADRLFTAGGALDRQSFVAYEGRKTTLLDPKGNATTRYADVRGNLRRVVDPAPGGTTHYAWDHFGNLLSATDPIGAITSATYDVRGFKRSSFDVDAGSWSYLPNSFGELVSQTDANGRTTTLAYDALGRITSRSELEGTSTWTWGNNAAAKNIGRLESLSGPGYSESFLYDALGRPVTTNYAADIAYQVNYAYHATTGLLDNVTYPVSTSGYRLRAQYVYTNGILSQVRDFNAPATVWWRVIAEDARGNPIDEQFGNGVHALSNYDELTGHLNWRTSGNNLQYNNHQNLTLVWDKNENLDQRVDVNQNNLTERFTYDTLDRLTGSTLNGATDLALNFDAAGNIKSKLGIGTETHSDVGTYTYHAVKRHAVTATSNGWKFTYDANGNMLTGRGSTIAWYSYNLPKTVTNGALRSEFFYTPDRRYWRQDAIYSTGSESTIYVGGLLEKVTNANGTQFRHMIRAGSTAIIVTRQSSGTNNTYYATQDSLGSTAVITNASGTVVVKENFGPFGNRRGATWQGTPSPSEWTGIANTTRRGFTGHTMVDNLNRIHMNGRMYDPFLGRFLSPDPFIQTLAQSQALNPYSYCWNNPLKYIDPSGFSIFSKIWKGIKGFFKSVLRSLNIVVAAALTVVGLITKNPALFKVAAFLLKSPVHVVKGPDGLGLSFAWGFGAGTGPSPGPPVGTPGINPTPGIPGLMSMSGMGMSGGAPFLTDKEFWQDILNRAVFILTPGYAASVEMERAFVEGRYVHAAQWLAIGLGEMFLATISAGSSQAVNLAVRARISTVDSAAYRATTGLSDDIARTFAGGKYHTKVLHQDVVVYRYSGGTSSASGRFLTTERTVAQIGSPVAARGVLNLPPGATAEQLNAFVIPRGTTIYYGRVAGGGDGATQIFIEDIGVLRPIP